MRIADFRSMMPATRNTTVRGPLVSQAARKLPGSGLGLAIVKQVAEAHGGGVGAERPKGGGTVMRLRLSGSNGAGPA